MSKFEFNVSHFYGERGQAWLQNLPQLIEAYARQYGLSELAPFSNLTHNYVMAGWQGGSPIVLKLGLESAFLKREACALEAYAGIGAVKLLAKDEGVLLLERAVPGGSLKSLFPQEDDQAARIVCSVMRRLHKAKLPAEGTLPSINKWLAMLNRSWPIPGHHLHKARHLRDQLLATSAEQVLLHGDLHHDNILQQGDDCTQSISKSMAESRVVKPRERTLEYVTEAESRKLTNQEFERQRVWIAVDPKGVIGEPAFEVGAFIRNPIPKLLESSNALNIISKRIALFAQILELPAERLLNWCFVQAVLCWIWVLEDRGHPAIQSTGTEERSAKYFMQLTEILHNLPHHKNKPVKNSSAFST